MSKNDVWEFRIKHILQAIDEILEFVDGMDFDAFVRDTKTLKAVERNIEIIGEAASKVPEAVRNAYPQVPWSAMKGMRNAISHGYDQVEYESVWDVVKFRLADLKRMLGDIPIHEDNT